MRRAQAAKYMKSREILDGSDMRRFAGPS